FVCTYGRTHDFVKVLDFGLARPLQTEDDLRITHEGAGVGTPGYMAPEQVSGLDAGPSADLYALGCVAYWLLAGTPPFAAHSAAELMRQHAQAAPAPLGMQAPQAIPPELERVVMACLAKDPCARPRDADEAAARLLAGGEGEPWSAGDARAEWEANRPRA